MKGLFIPRAIIVASLTIGGYLWAQMGCAPRMKVSPPEEEPSEPNIRVAIIQEAEEIVFSCSSGFRVADGEGKFLFTSGVEDDSWKVKLKYGKPAVMFYRLVLYEEKNPVEAQKRLEQLTAMGWKAKILVVGKELRIRGRLLNDNQQYWVTVGPYGTQQEASSFQGQLPPGAGSRVVQDLSEPSLGALDLIDPSGKVVLSSAEFFSLQPRDTEGLFTIYGVVVGRGFDWERQEDRMYRGKLEFRLGNDGCLLCVNELPLETYLKGTLPKEMNPGFPPAALRAQAVAARSYTIARWGIQHRLDSFDLCSQVHCQAYAGVTLEHPVTNEAVDDTRGQVLVYQDLVCETFYSAVCGGHTERNENVWEGSQLDYLDGRIDAQPADARLLPGSLGTDEKVLRDWIESTPPVFCNHLSEDAPRALHYTRKHFRWKFTYSRQELEEILKEKLQQPIGHLLNIVPIRRGVSGRCIAVRIVGDRGEVSVEGELNIRRVLSPTHLPSACFVVEQQIGPDDLPSSFTILGAGWGHGVGMCQAGAAGMALRGYSPEEILAHYYAGASLRQLYGTLF